MTVTFPEAVKSQGRISVTAVPVADLESTATPSLADLAAGVNISMYLYAGSGMASSTTATGEAPRRLGSSETEQEFGTTSRTIADLSYVYSPQAPDGDPANAAKELLEEGEMVYLVYRFGVDADTPLAVGDKVNIWRAQLGPQNEGSTGDGDFDQLNITQAAISKSPPVKGVVLVA